MLESLIMSHLILASGSPRRREMLAWVGLSFDLRPVDADESTLPDESPAKYVARLADLKARSAADGDGQAVLAADTTVADADDILGKPGNAGEARAMLRRLRGHTHQVYTALTVYLPQSGWLHDICCSQVPMRRYSDAEMDMYIASGDPMDKAGAYAIQNQDFHPVTDFSGCFANVMGLPLCHLTRTLRAGSVELPVDVPRTCQDHLAYNCPVYQAVLAGRDIG